MALLHQQRAERGALHLLEAAFGEHREQHVLAALGRIRILAEQAQHERDGGAESGAPRVPIAGPALRAALERGQGRLAVPTGSRRAAEASSSAHQELLVHQRLGIYEIFLANVCVLSRLAGLALCCWV